MPSATHNHLRVLDGGRSGFATGTVASAPTQPLTTIVHVIATRPDFVKMAPVIRALEERGAFRQVVVHTGQHYDLNMSDHVLADLDLPAPDRFLSVGSGPHGHQTGLTMIAFERVLADERPAAVVLAGGVNSTLGCALAAAKRGVAVVHVEAGVRSFDWSAPEEINQILTDRLSDLLFTPSVGAGENLRVEGIEDSRILHVGSTAVDCVRRLEARARRRCAWTRFGVNPRQYALVTLHRPANVDAPERLLALVDGLVAMAARFPVLFAIHPRTRARLGEMGLRRLEEGGVRALEPLGYLDFLSLQSAAGAVVTDSGSVQEETSALGVRCYTLRPGTDRPITVTHGTNQLLGDDPASLREVDVAAWEPTPSAIPLWDGRAGERIADALVANFALTRVVSGA